MENVILWIRTNLIQILHSIVCTYRRRKKWIHYSRFGFRSHLNLKAKDLLQFTVRPGIYVLAQHGLLRDRISKCVNTNFSRTSLYVHCTVQYVQHTKIMLCYAGLNIAQHLQKKYAVCTISAYMQRKLRNTPIGHRNTWYSLLKQTVRFLWKRILWNFFDCFNNFWKNKKPIFNFDPQQLFLLYCNELQQVKLNIFYSLL